MRCAAAFAALTTCLVLPLVAAPPSGAEPDLTVVLDFKGSYAAPAIDEMRKESARILAGAGLRIGWTTVSEAEGQSFRELVVMRFNGSCMFQPAPSEYDEPGPFAVTASADGIVQPFGRVDCDHVAHAAANAMAPADYCHADFLVGRALGRVVAHELVHMITRSTQHGRDGVEMAALSGKQLIAASLLLSREDAEFIKLERKLH